MQVFICSLINFDEIDKFCSVDERAGVMIDNITFV